METEEGVLGEETGGEGEGWGEEGRCWYVSIHPEQDEGEFKDAVC